MAISVIQRRTGTGTSSATVSAWSTPAAGNIIILFVGNNDGGAIAISGYTELTGAQSANAGQILQVFGKVSAGNESAPSGSNAFANQMGIFAVELDGAVNTSIAAALDKDAHTEATGSASNAISGETSLAQSAEYAAAALWVSGDTSGHSWNSGLTLRMSTVRMAAADLSTAATTALNPTVTWVTSRISRHSFITIKASITAPTVTTSAATNVAATTATGNGNVTSSGDSLVTQRGFVWDTNVNPTTALSTKVTVAGTTGSYSGSMTSLTPGTLYHYRAYAINDAGTSYGADTTFTPGAPGFFQLMSP